MLCVWVHNISYGGRKCFNETIIVAFPPKRYYNNVISLRREYNVIMCVSLINRERNTMRFRLFAVDKAFFTSQRIRILLIKAHRARLRLGVPTYYYSCTIFRLLLSGSVCETLLLITTHFDTLMLSHCGVTPTYRTTVVGCEILLYRCIRR